ncbi:enoyl-CoA hydratase-related protein [Pseudonocardia kujensis]|uniref:enoyl-CoA hydratase-related protein n=1 Tax=Pseudonocardia kujensis TaxID=1128675 RepID=UPI001E2843C6|nr:enoyl-CoA hydratase-related protein [Pseudonocardia kujensis]MCE0761990.1 enoyl-CoA hydratase-related protein [Pseudonocardia kujensis]
MEDLLVEHWGHVARVTIDRPKALNAVTVAMDLELARIWDVLDPDPGVRVIVLRSSGDRAFCAGGDVREEGARPRIALGGGLTGVGGPLRTLRTPLVCAVQGYALGGGFELAVCGDVIVAADTARFGITEARIGNLAEVGPVHRAVRQLPQRVAMGMILTGEHLTADHALAHGLVNEVVPAAELHAAADRWAERIAECSPLAAQAAKDAALSRVGWPLEIALSTRYEPIEQYATSHDRAEGLAAFAERRAPLWEGR